MIERCSTPTHQDYAGYGGRGITVCQRWRDGFLNFLSDTGRRPSEHYSLDRYPDNDGNYEPNNVRWATAKQQARNRRNNKLTEESARLIRASQDTQRNIAAAYGVAQSMISRIRSGVHWA